MQKEYHLLILFLLSSYSKQGYHKNIIHLNIAIDINKT